MIRDVLDFTGARAAQITVLCLFGALQNTFSEVESTHDFGKRR